MSDSNESELAGTKEPLIITPEEAAARLRQRTKPVPDGGKGGKYNISRAEAVSIAAQIGQQVYDEIRKEHAMTMQLLQEDLAKHFADIRRTVVINILDIQRRSFSYRVRAAFEYDCQRISERVKTRYELALAWLELHGLREAAPPKAPSVPADPQSVIAGAIAAENGEPIAKAFDVDVDDIIEAPEVATALQLHVGAPTNEAP